MFLPVTVMSPTCTVVGDVSRPSPSIVEMPRGLDEALQALVLARDDLFAITR